MKYKKVITAIMATCMLTLQALPVIPELAQAKMVANAEETTSDEEHYVEENIPSSDPYYSPASFLDFEIKPTGKTDSGEMKFYIKCFAKEDFCLTKDVFNDFSFGKCSLVRVSDLGVRKTIIENVFINDQANQSGDYQYISEVIGEQSRYCEEAFKAKIDPKEKPLEFKNGDVVFECIIPVEITDLTEKVQLEYIWNTFTVSKEDQFSTVSKTTDYNKQAPDSRSYAVKKFTLTGADMYAVNNELIAKQGFNGLSGNDIDSEYDDRINKEAIDYVIEYYETGDVFVSFLNKDKDQITSPEKKGTSQNSTYTVQFPLIGVPSGRNLTITEKVGTVPFDLKIADIFYPDKAWLYKYNEDLPSSYVESEEKEDSAFLSKYVNGGEDNWLTVKFSANNDDWFSIGGTLISFPKSREDTFQTKELKDSDREYQRNYYNESSLKSVLTNENCHFLYEKQEPLHFSEYEMDGTVYYPSYELKFDKKNGILFKCDVIPSENGLPADSLYMNYAVLKEDLSKPSVTVFDSIRPEEVTTFRLEETNLASFYKYAAKTPIRSNAEISYDSLANYCYYDGSPKRELLFREGETYYIILNSRIDRVRFLENSYVIDEYYNTDRYEHTPEEKKILDAYSKAFAAPYEQISTEKPAERPMGDVTGDQVVDILDVIRINKFILGVGSLEYTDTADIDGNGQVDSNDSLNILKIALDMLKEEDILKIRNK